MPSIPVDSFPRGMWRAGSRESAPAGSAYELQNYLLQPDGKPFRRGGSQTKSNAGFGSAGLSWIRDEQLGGGQRTVFGASGGVAVLDSDDQTPITSRVNSGTANPVRPAILRGMLWLPSIGGNNITGYGGSRKVGAGDGASYSTGTASFQANSTAVTGVGTTWTTNLDAGMLMTNAAGVGNTGVPIKSVNSNTSLTLAHGWAGITAPGITYSARAWNSIGIPSGLLGDYWISNATLVEAVANRLVGAFGQTVFFTSATDPWTVASGDQHVFPATILALAGLRDVLLVFTAAGVYGVFNMAYNLTDPAGNPQQRKELISAELIGWSHEGIASWSGAVIVPCLDGVWLVNAQGAPTRISTSIRDLYLSYVQAGYKTGVATVYNNHYFLPILNASNVWQDTLVCDLAHEFRWMHFAGSGAQISGFARRQAAPPQLLGASTLTASRVLKLPYFEPSATVKNDHDGTAHQTTLSVDLTSPDAQPPYWERLRATTEGTVENLVLNPGAEVDTSNTATTAGGFMTAGATITRDTANVHSGNGAFKVVTTAASGTQGIALTLSGTFHSGVTYTAEVWLKGNAGGESAQVLLVDAASGDLSATTTIVTLTTGWQKFTHPWTPSGERITGRLLLMTPSAAAITFYADDASVWQTSTLSVTAQRPSDTSAIALNGGISGIAAASATSVSAVGDGSTYSWWEAFKRGRTIRLTLTTTGALSTFVVHKLEAIFRQQGRQ